MVERSVPLGGDSERMTGKPELTRYETTLIIDRWHGGHRMSVGPVLASAMLRRGVGANPIPIRTRIRSDDRALPWLQAEAVSRGQ